jgi:hypothetical protein
MKFLTPDERTAVIMALQDRREYCRKMAEASQRFEDYSTAAVWVLFGGQAHCALDKITDEPNLATTSAFARQRHGHRQAGSALA